MAEGAGPGGYSVPFHSTARVGVRDSLVSWKSGRGFSGGNVAGRGSHLPLFIVTQGVQEHFACKSLFLLYTFFINIVAITVHFLISLLFAVNCAYLNL